MILTDETMESLDALQIEYAGKASKSFLIWTMACQSCSNSCRGCEGSCGGACQNGSNLPME